MNKKLVLMSLLGLICHSLLSANLSKTENTPPLRFTENKGQVADQNHQPRLDVLFEGNDGQLSFHIRNNGISYQLLKTTSWKETLDLKTKSKKKEIGEQIIYRVDVNWLNVNPGLSVGTGEVQFGYRNYYLQQCPQGITGVKSFDGVLLSDIYKNINLRYYQKEGHLKYDYIVAPQGDYRQIQLEIKGAVISRGSSGTLILKTPFGEIEEGKPVVFQNGKSLEAEWTIQENVLGFEIKNYDPSVELIIDPLTRLWGTYYGGIGVEEGSHCTTDGAGNVYKSGSTQSTALGVIATTGAHQVVFGGTQDAFLVKFNGSGQRQWCTYYGGSNSDYGTSCSTESSGRVYLAGYTNSAGSNVISTGGSHQPNPGGNTDAFLVQFDAAGNRQWATYYGGSFNDFASASCTDAQGNVYMAGSSNTGQGSGIATTNGHQPIHGGGNGDYDAFLVKFNGAGVRQWGTYYGGTNIEYGNSCTTDAIGNVIMAGFTNSSDPNVIATNSAHQTTFAGPADAFLVKFNTSGLRQWGTYYGGGDDDIGNGCSSDASGNIYLAGYTQSSGGTAIATTTAHQPVFGGDIDAFLVKFNGNGVRIWGTYYGGTGTDIGSDCTLDPFGNVYFLGDTKTSTPLVISTINAFQPLISGGFDAFLVQFDQAGQRQWATYYGGGGEDFAQSCAADLSNNIYVTGTTDTDQPGVIASPGSFQPLYEANGDDFLVKFGCVFGSPTLTANNPACMGAPISFSTQISTTLTLTYNWNGPNSFVAVVQNPSVANAQPLNAGTYSLIIQPGSSCAEMAVITVTVSSCTGFAQNGPVENALRLYPNPTSGIFVLELPKESEVAVINLLGNVIYKGRQEDGMQILDLEKQPAGVYLLRVSDSDLTRTLRIIKQ